MVLIRNGVELGHVSGELPDLETYLAGNEGDSVLLSPDVDLETLKPRLSGLALIEVSFPSFTDGRGFSVAKQLRRLGYEGELIATGPLIPDQYLCAVQCGFDAVKIEQECYVRQSEGEWNEALHAFDLFYQRGYVRQNPVSRNITEARYE
ncbi:MAG: hypothetical protein COA43_05235 [Robiginitomaculum sp.]|nr:MAG: hypothetical protein COA43_05235 [Robiginitomaculum sp.]